MDHLSKEELRALLTVAKAKRERDWLMILVSFWHGLRASEVVGITPDDIRDGYLSVQRLKGSKFTVQALVVHPDPLFSERDALIAFARFVPQKQRVFPITRQHFWALFQEYGEAAGIPAHKRHPHVAKHTIAMQMIDKAGIHKVRQRLGHESIASTGEYLKEQDATVDSVVVDAVEL